MADYVSHELDRPLPSERSNQFDAFFSYIYERQLIWHKRFVERLPRPWTRDPTLAHYSFTNAFRELDRGTIHFRDVAWPQIKHLSPAYQLFWTVVYRWFNRTEVWDQLLTDWVAEDTNLFDMAKALHNYAATVGPVWTGAYMVCAYHGAEGDNKIDRVINFLIALRLRLYLAHLDFSSTEQFHRWLQTSGGIGPFGAYEILSDLLMVRWGPLAPFSENDWANPGPGARKGLILVRDDQTDFSRTKMVAMMRELQANQQVAFGLNNLPFARVAVKNDDGSTRWLSMRNIEHSLCEMSKYARKRCRTTFIQHTF